VVYRFAFRGRWLIGQFVVLAIAATFIRLGIWQFTKYRHTKAQNSVTAARRAMPVAALDELLSPDARAGGDSLQRRVSVTGRFDAARQVVLLFRSLDGQPGSDVLTPLVTGPGHAVIVNRGWVSSSDPSASLPPRATPPAGTVRLTGLVLPGEPPGDERGAASGSRLATVSRADLGLLQRHLPYHLYPVLVQLQTQEPAQASGIPEPLPPAPLDGGPYFSYSMQWFLFTTVGLVGWPLLIRHSAREDQRMADRRPSARHEAPAGSSGVAAG
jgi:cytochrome oxidase assembly protein ShyY1